MAFIVVVYTIAFPLLPAPLLSVSSFLLRLCGGGGNGPAVWERALSPAESGLLSRQVEGILLFLFLWRPTNSIGRLQASLQL